MGETPRKKSSYSQFEMNSNLDDTFIPLVKEIYKKTLRSFRRIFLNVNTHHPLFYKFTSKVK